MEAKMRKRSIWYIWTIALALTFFWAVPSAWSEQIGEDPLVGPSLDLGSAWDLMPTGETDGLPTLGWYSGLASSDERLLHNRESRLRSAYITQSGELTFTESTDCNRLRPVCVGRMGIGGTIITPDSQ